MLTVTNMSKTFGGLVAIDHVDIEIGPEEIVGLIGPNGAGKTTLFNTISGIYEPDDGGSVEFQGTEVVDEPPHAIAKEGLVRSFQIVRVFDEMTVLENAMVGALFGNEDVDGKTEAERVATEAVEFVGLGSDRHRDAASLTVPAKKQLELARALATDPSMVMLDEIASGLTPREITELSDLIRSIRDDRGVSVFWIEHIMDAIMGTADRVIVLDSGQKIANGTPEEIRNNERVVEAYLGDGA